MGRIARDGISRTAYRNSAAKILPARYDVGARSRIRRRNKSETARKTGNEGKGFSTGRRGRVQSEIEVVPPQAGQDLVTTIDLDLQQTAEEQLAASVTKRGTIISLDPNNGEVLAMASAPSFDPNAFVTRSTTPEGRKEISNYYTNEERPLLNRAIQGRYHPGSTWKIPESVSALRQGAITVEHSSLACGGGIQVGNKFTRCMGSWGSKD